MICLRGAVVAQAANSVRAHSSLTSLWANRCAMDDLMRGIVEAHLTELLPVGDVLAFCAASHATSCEAFLCCARMAKARVRAGMAAAMEDGLEFPFFNGSVVPEAVWDPHLERNPLAHFAACWGLDFASRTPIDWIGMGLRYPDTPLDLWLTHNAGTSSWTSACYLQRHVVAQAWWSRVAGQGGTPERCHLVYLVDGTLGTALLFRQARHPVDDAATDSGGGSPVVPEGPDSDATPNPSTVASSFVAG